MLFFKGISLLETWGIKFNKVNNNTKNTYNKPTVEILTVKIERGYAGTDLHVEDTDSDYSTQQLNLQESWT